DPDCRHDRRRRAGARRARHPRRSPVRRALRPQRSHHRRAGLQPSSAGDAVPQADRRARVLGRRARARAGVNDSADAAEARVPPSDRHAAEGAMNNQPASRASLLTPRFVLVVSCGLSYFLALAMLTPVIPHYVEDELGNGSIAVGIAVGAFAFGAILLRP